MSQCSEEVWFDNWHKSQCSKKVVVERDGKPYCKIHDPEYIRVKEAKRKASYEAGNCKNCSHHFQYYFYSYCPMCGTKRSK